MSKTKVLDTKVISEAKKTSTPGLPILKDDNALVAKKEEANKASPEARFNRDVALLQSVDK